MCRGLASQPPMVLAVAGVCAGELPLSKIIIAAVLPSGRCPLCFRHRRACGGQADGCCCRHCPMPVPITRRNQFCRRVSFDTAASPRGRSRRCASSVDLRRVDEGNVAVAATAMGAEEARADRRYSNLFDHLCV